MTPRHVPALDGLRGIAILLVVTFHFGLRIFWVQDSALEYAIERVLYVGWAGVDVFFVLSGYLITTILLNARGRPRYFKTFYTRRVLRIFPTYFGALAFGLLALPLLWPARGDLLGQSPEHPMWLLTFTSNLGLATHAVQTFGVFDILWSVAIEEQFYLVWPALVRILRLRALALACGTLAIGAPLLRAAWLAAGHRWGDAYHFTFMRFDELAIGGLVALALADPIRRQRARRIARTGAGIGALALAALFAAADPFYPENPLVLVVGQWVIAFTTAFIIVLAVEEGSRVSRLLEARWLRFCGRVSYGVYVWHWALLKFFEKPYSRLRPPNAAVARLAESAAFFAIGITGSFLWGWLSYELYEKWFLRLKVKVTH